MGHCQASWIVCVTVCVLMGLRANAAQLDRDEYAVYAAFLSAQTGARTRPSLVIAAETADGADGKMPARPFDGEQLRSRFADKSCCAGTVTSHDPLTIEPRAPYVLESDVLESFQRVHTQRVSLDTSRLNVARTRVVPTVELEAVFDGPGSLDDKWKAFWNRFGGAWVTLSRVGFSRDRSRALLGVSFGCGSLCGEGRYVLMVKSNGRWRIGAEVSTWVS
jgi:hypothetical protein